MLVSGAVVIGGVGTVTGRAPIGLWGLSKRFSAVTWGPIGAIGRLVALDRLRKCVVRSLYLGSCIEISAPEDVGNTGSRSSDADGIVPQAE